MEPVIKSLNDQGKLLQADLHTSLQPHLPAQPVLQDLIGALQQHPSACFEKEDAVLEDHQLTDCQFMLLVKFGKLAYLC